MLENNLIVIDSDVTDENILAVLAAVQAFEKAAIEKNIGWNRVHKVNRPLEFKTHLICPSVYHLLFQRCLSTLVYISADILPNINYTYACDISIAKAKAISANTDKPLALALGILLGCESSTLADVSNLCPEFFNYSTVYLDTVLDAKYPETAKDEKCRLFGKGLSDLDTLERRISFVFGSKVIVGYSSFETYLGCCLQKPVIEIQKDPSLYKWSNKNYQCITDDSTLQDLLPKAISQCLLAINA